MGYLLYSDTGRPRSRRHSELSGTIHRETGRWRVEDYLFCMQFRAFGRGREVCPWIVEDGQKIIATQRDNKLLPWSLGKIKVRRFSFPPD